jgi:hypothetical protein
MTFREGSVLRRLGTLDLPRAAALALVSILAGCAADGGKGGDPGAIALPAGSTCQSVRAELTKLDAKGTQPKVEAASRGQKLSPQAQADVDRYNELLNLYLGARCHVM